MTPIPFLIFSKDSFCRKVGAVVEGKQQIAMAFGIIRLHRQRFAIDSFGFCMAALCKQDHSKVGQPAMLIRRE